MTTIHWNSRTVWGRMPPRAVQLWNIYAAMINHEGVAWPSLTLLTSLLGTRKRDVASDTRRWLIAHGALEVVADYVPPAQRAEPAAQPVPAHEAPMYVRMTGRIVIDGESFSLAYFPGLERGTEEDEAAAGHQTVTTPQSPNGDYPSHQTVTTPQSPFGDPPWSPNGDPNLIPIPPVVPKEITPSPATPARARESEFAEKTEPHPVLAAWQAVGGGLLRHSVEFLRGAVKEYGEAFVLAAIAEAGDSSAGAVNVKYLRSILEACRKEGRFPGAARAPQSNRRAQGKEPDRLFGPNGSISEPVEYTVTESDLETLRSRRQESL
jgi:hypothetical protein